MSQAREPDDDNDRVLFLGENGDGAEPSAASAGADSSGASNGRVPCYSEWSEVCPDVFLSEYAEQPPRFYRSLEECKASFHELLVFGGHQLAGIMCEPKTGDDGTDRFTIRCGTVKYQTFE